MVIADLNESRTAKDLAEQCIKVLELICTREAGGVFEAGGLTCVLGFIRDNGGLIHKDTLHSAMAVVSRLCSKMEPNEDSLGVCSYNFFSTTYSGFVLSKGQKIPIKANSKN